MAYFVYTDSVYGDINLGSYNETKSDCYNEEYSYLIGMAMEMIYYQHWSNSIMYDYLNGNNDISTIIDNSNIPTMEYYLDNKKLF